MSDKDTMVSQVPGYLKRVEKVNPEQALHDALSGKYEERFTAYRQSYAKTFESNDPAKEELTEYPITVLLELLNKCNLACPMCLSSHREGDKVVVSSETLERLFADFKDNNLQALMFGAGEEPLLYKNISDLWDKADDAEIMDVFLFTNGTLLTEKRCEEIVDRQIPRIFVSIDAATPETYDIVRPRNSTIAKIGVNRLEQIEENIKRLVDIRNKKGSKLPLVRLSFAVQDANKHEVDLFREKWEDIVDFIEFQACADFTAVDDFTKLSEEEIWERQPLDPRLEGRAHCNSPWQTMTIWYDGSVAPCCTFNGKAIPIGNIHEQTVKEVWNGEKMNELRDQFRTGELNKVCQYCLLCRDETLFDEVEQKRA